MNLGIPWVLLLNLNNKAGLVPVFTYGGKMKNLKIKGFEFESCKEKIPYSLIHDSKPIRLSDEMTMSLELLLWYVPNINSMQSSKNELVSSMDFDDFVFGICKEKMNLNNSDVCFLDDISPDVVNFYLKGLCPQDEKLILTRALNESKTDSLLRHIRNSIAHGCFNVVSDLFIGFDFKSSANKLSECSAIIKIKPQNLLKALLALEDEVTSERLAQIALQRTGYYVEKFEKYDSSHSFDFFVKKDNKNFALELKKYNDFETLPQDEVDKLVRQFENISNDLIPILFINTSLLTDKSKERLLQEKIIILDIKNIKKMLKKRDMIGEIVKDSGAL